MSGTTAFWKVFWALLILTFLQWSHASAGTSSEFQKILDNNPEMKKAGVYLKISKFENGYLTIDAYDITGDTAKQIRTGTSLEALATLKGDEGSTLLKNVSDIFKKRPEIKWSIL